MAHPEDHKPVLEPMQPELFKTEEQASQIAAEGIACPS